MLEFDQFSGMEAENCVGQAGGAIRMKSPKVNVLDEIRYDINFLKSHTLQPKWYKIFKVFILLGFLVGYAVLFGLGKTLIFLVTFSILSAIVHMTYRVKTQKFTQTWRDFIVYREQGGIRMKRIGKYYYLLVLMNAVIAVIASQVLG